ncbi:hypothetical protein H072_2393 [Dactylellina haptotyla CBS 200.50]|uniref:Uncharacterized protein n=1 Tax=Dactylellina haptotyla (strain CBS 200.50) TaxID=1284197 RepID=S8ARA2_DACHA|nr:hypothetical protein H072_2393 [Dactylellina haptotyla CBS 200.50]
MTLSVKFGDTLVTDDSTVSAGSIPSSPVFTLNSPNVPIPDNTRYTIVLMDITTSRNPTTEAVLHYAASNLQAPSKDGGELKFGAMNFEYVPPAAGTKASYIFLVYSQLDGDIELNLQSVPAASDTRQFSVSVFRQDNGFQLADTGIGFTVDNSAGGESTSSTSAPPLTTPPFSFPNTTTTASSSSTPESTTSLPVNTTTTFSTSETPAPPAPPSTSYLTLSVSGSTRTVIYTAPNDPGSTLGPVSTTTSANPSLITNEPSTGSQNIVSRSAMALLAFCAVFVAFV